MNIPNDPESDDSWKLLKDPRDLKALQQANP